MWCNAPLNGHTPVLFEELPNFTQQPSTFLFKHCWTLWRSTLPDYLLLVSIVYNAKELELFTCHLPTKMALANFTCQVCFLWVKVIDGEVKIAISSFSAQQGMIILPLRAILVGMYVHHMGKTPHSALWVFIGMDNLSPHLSSML